MTDADLLVGRFVFCTVLLTAVLLTRFSDVQGFHPPVIQTRQLNKQIHKQENFRVSSSSPVILHVQQSEQDDNDTDKSKKASSSSNDALSTLKTGVLYLFAAAALGGVLLNFLGYGYTASLSEGFRVDSLSELQMERTLQQQPTARPPGGISEYFLKNPFTASCIITACVLAYESLVDGKGKKK